MCSGSGMSGQLVLTDLFSPILVPTLLCVAEIVRGQDIGLRIS